MTSIRGLRFSIPLLNSSCPWASNIDDLKALYASPFTGGVTTRTSTLNGFPDNPSIHQVGISASREHNAFIIPPLQVAFSSASATSLNSYGYSPYPLSQYLGWIKELVVTN